MSKVAYWSAPKNWDGRSPIPLAKWRVPIEGPYRFRPAHPWLLDLSSPITEPTALFRAGREGRLWADVVWADRVGDHIIAVIANWRGVTAMHIHRGVSLCALGIASDYRYNARRRRFERGPRERYSNSRRALIAFLTRERPTLKQRRARYDAEQRLALASAKAALAELHSRRIGADDTEHDAWLRRQLAGLGKGARDGR